MKLLIFDIDGTITHLSGATTRAFKIAFEKAFSREGNVQGLKMHGRTDPLIFRDCFINSGMSGDWRAAFEIFKPHYLEALPGMLADTPHAKLHPGILELLDELTNRKESCALALGTGNAEEGARKKVGHFNLNHHFPVGGYGDVHDERYLIMQDALYASVAHYKFNFQIENVWVIGDTIFDVEGGKKIGAKTLGVATGGAFSVEDLKSSGADAVFENLADTNAVLRAMDIDLR